jgi:hypothetical protein
LPEVHSVFLSSEQIHLLPMMCAQGDVQASPENPRAGACSPEHRVEPAGFLSASGTIPIFHFGATRRQQPHRYSGGYVPEQLGWESVEHLHPDGRRGRLRADRAPAP